MSRLTPLFALLPLVLASLTACGPSPHEAAARSEAAAPAQATPAAPAKPMKMICRDSRTGAKATCGAPNAVMVGMAPE